MLPIGISDDGLVSAALDKKKKGLEAAIKDVMGNEPGLPPFDLEPLPPLHRGNFHSTWRSCSLKMPKIFTLQRFGGRRKR